MVDGAQARRGRGFAFETLFAGALLVLYAAFWLWQTPGVLRGPLRSDETEAYLVAIERSLVAPATVKARLLADLRAWSARDDARPVFMLNLMRYHETLEPFPGAPRFEGSPAASNAYYESRVMPLALAAGDYPLYAGTAIGSNLTGHDPAVDDWSRVIVMRYPSRRHFLQLLADPAYGPLLPYKLMALELALVPTEGEIVVPELRWSVGAALLVLFLGVGWLRAARRAQ